VLLLVLAFAGCTPTCKQVCDKIVDCDGLPTERMSSAECAESCEAQDDLYDQWTDAEKRHAFDDERACIGDATCDELADGACYDPEVWSY
jgi:hypothetical protein